jgi:hypothetical protein
MAIENNWIQHNLMKRFTDHHLSFEVKINPNPYKEMSFHDAADCTAQKIYQKYPKLFLSFSGGADSDYVFHCFQRNNIPFTPILVKTSGNTVELEYAFHTCRKFNITPVVLELSDADLLAFFHKEILNKLNSVGLCAIPGIIACKYAKEHGGVLVIGEHMIDYEGENIFPAMNEWDFYNEIFVGDEYNVPFFNYTTELAVAMISRIEPMPISEWKWQLYNIDYRPVIDYVFVDTVRTLIFNIRCLRVLKTNTHHSFGTKEDFLNVTTQYQII